MIELLVIMNFHTISLCYLVIAVRVDTVTAQLLRARSAPRKGDCAKQALLTERGAATEIKRKTLINQALLVIY